MASLFNYNTLNVSLDSQTRSLTIELNRPDTNNSINSEMIFELESMFAWAGSHLEINSILLTSSTDVFCSGLDKNELANCSDEKLQRNLSKIQKLIYSFYFLPQTIIVDLKNGASGIGAEFSLGADIRISNSNAELSFDHLNNGFVPHCGGVGFLNALVGNSIARQWIMSSLPVKASTLKQQSYLLETYSENSNELRSTLLTAISKQAPVARIQAKRSLLDSILPELDRALDYEKTFALSGMCTKDWKKIVCAENSSEVEFTSARDLAMRLKEEKQQQEL